MKKSPVMGAVLFLFALSQTALAVPAQMPDPKAMEKEMKKMQEQMEKSRKEQMEALRKMDPKAYEMMAKQEERAGKVSKIVTDYHGKKISYEAARSQLYPLLKDDMKAQLANIDNDIKMAEQRLSDLKKAKSNSDHLVYLQIDSMLGKGSGMGGGLPGLSMSAMPSLPAMPMSDEGKKN